MLSRWLIWAAVLAGLECSSVVAFQVALTVPAQAQRLDDRYPFLSRQRPQRPSGFFRGFFGGFTDRPRQQEEQQQQVDHSRAPVPRKPDSKAPPVVPTISIVVMGDGMADWLAYGLEDAFSDAPEIGIVRKNKERSGLLRYEYKSQLDWWHVARDTLAPEKANYVIMMLGVSDRQNIREKDLATEDDQENPGGQPNTQNKDGSNSDRARIVAPEPQPAKKSNGIIEFRSDRWVQVYSHRVDETVAALKSKGVPVFWVGLPSIRGTKSTADAVFLNDIYRARAERAGAIYVDVWDGFVDEAGKFSSYGPDYEGQMRRLRSSDGVYFTKAGARKLAHFVERELRRYMNSHVTPVALPAGPVEPAPLPGKSAARPIAGPVVPLTVTPTNSNELVGGAGVHPTHIDPTANRVLIKGEPVPAPPGRADDFAWPSGSDRKSAQPEFAGASASAAAPAANAAVRSDTPIPPTAPARKPVEKKDGAASKTNQNTGERTKLANEKKQPSQSPPPRSRSRHDPLGWFR